LQGVNWTPIRPNFADLTKQDYEKLLTSYKKMGLNTIRVWGGAFAEKDWLYELCDQYGIMVWQEFPMSSSGWDNYPPTDPNVIQEMAKTVRVYVKRLRSHVSIIQWCGGNELYELGDGAPVTNKHPMINSLYEIVSTEDPTRRFIPGSPCGPNIWGDRKNFGKGINWETHGPWKIPFDNTKNDYSMASVFDYWSKNDALMNSEVGVSGASSVKILEKYAGEYKSFPASFDNILWKQQFSFWTDWDDYLKEHDNKEPKDLETYVNWSQKRQAEALAIAVESCKNRFPNSGGALIWMGHDAFPVTANTSIIDFEGNLKPAAELVSKVWLKKQNKY
jgi:beta-mannosidase